MTPATVQDLRQRNILKVNMGVDADELVRPNGIWKKNHNGCVEFQFTYLKDGREGKSLLFNFFRV